MTDPGTKNWRMINELCGRMAGEGALRIPELYELERLIAEVRIARGDSVKGYWDAADALANAVDYFLKQAELCVWPPMSHLLRELKSAWGRYELAKAQRAMINAGKKAIEGEYRCIAGEEIKAGDPVYIDEGVAFKLQRPMSLRDAINSMKRFREIGTQTWLTTDSKGRFINPGTGDLHHINAMDVLEDRFEIQRG